MKLIYDRDADSIERGSFSRNTLGEPRIWISNFSKIPQIKILFDRYWFHLMMEQSGSNSPELVHVFYIFYAFSVYLITPQGKRARDQPPLTNILVWGTQIDMFEHMSMCFLFWTQNKVPLRIIDFDNTLWESFGYLLLKIIQALLVLIIHLPLIEQFWWQVLWQGMRSILHNASFMRFMRELTETAQVSHSPAY